MKYVLKGDFVPGEKVGGEFKIGADDLEELKSFLMDGMPRLSKMMFHQVITELLKVETSRENKIAMLGMIGLCAVQETAEQITRAVNQLVGEIEKGEWDNEDEDDEEECGYCEKDLKECKRRGRKKH